MKKLFLLFLLMAVTQAQAAWTLVWNPVVDPYIVGYNLFVGTAPGREVLYKKLGVVSTFTFTPAQPTGTYFAYITAVYSNGASSMISNEVSWTTDTPTPTPAPAASGLKVTITTPSPSPTATP
jgi:hypothetical protein